MQCSEGSATASCGATMQVHHHQCVIAWVFRADSVGRCIPLVLVQVHATCEGMEELAVCLIVVRAGGA
jgi:hypothetical protein